MSNLWVELDDRLRRVGAGGANQKKAWFQTVTDIRESGIARIGVGRLCMLFGKSRKASYERRDFIDARERDEAVVLELVLGVWRELPGLGVHKLHWLLRQPLKTNGIKTGRDKLAALLSRHSMLVKRPKRAPKTTNSRHWLREYPNLVKEIVTSRADEVWVADITYLCVGNEFNYLFLLTGARSHKIIGDCLHRMLASDGALLALDMALGGRLDGSAGLDLPVGSERAILQLRLPADALGEQCGNKHDRAEIPTRMSSPSG
jgi:hypothetical protein